MTKPMVVGFSSVEGVMLLQGMSVMFENSEMLPGLFEDFMDEDIKYQNAIY